jgi:hypothetical protein
LRSIQGIDDAGFTDRNYWWGRIHRIAPDRRAPPTWPPSEGVGYPPVRGAVSCEKIGRVLGFRARREVEDGIVEIRDAIESGLIKDPSSATYRNHQFIVKLRRPVWISATSAS